MLDGITNASDVMGGITVGIFYGYCGGCIKECQFAIFVGDYCV